MALPVFAQTDFTYPTPRSEFVTTTSPEPFFPTPRTEYVTKNASLSAGGTSPVPSGSVAPAGSCPPNELCNPIGQDNFQDLVNAIVVTLPKIIIPLAVIIIIWIGIKFFLAQGNTEKIKKARDALLWTVVGLAIILIGTGFVSLIKSILDLRK